MAVHEGVRTLARSELVEVPNLLVIQVPDSEHKVQRDTVHLSYAHQNGESDNSDENDTQVHSSLNFLDMLRDAAQQYDDL